MLLSSSSPSTPDFPSATNSSVIAPNGAAYEGGTSFPPGTPSTLRPEYGLECPDCQRRISCTARLKNHQCNTKRFLCDFDGCTGRFTLEKDLKRHRQSVHVNKALLLVCQVCRYKTPRKDHLKRYERSHQNGRRKRAIREERRSESQKEE